MVGIDYRQIVLAGIAFTLVAGLGIVSVRLDVLWVFVPLVTALFAGGFVLAVFHHQRIAEDIRTLDENIEGTRQHVTLLARHTRELHDVFSQSMPGWPMPQASGAVSADDFAVLSTLVRDLADSLSELDRKCEAMDLSLEDLRRLQDGAGRTASGTTGWVTAAKPTSAAKMMPGMKPAPQVTRQMPRAVEAGSSPAYAQDGQGYSSPAYAAPAPQMHMPEASPPNSHMGQEPSRAVRQLVAAAIAADRFELYLQRIVSLPQRKIRGYEIMLRPEGAEHSLDNGAIRAAVESVGHQLMFDRRMMVQAVRLARVFEKRGRDVLLYVDISQRFLMSRDALDEVASLMEEAPGIASRIVLCLPNRFFHKAASFERDALRELAGHGFTFMAREVDIGEIDFAALTSCAVRWMRIATADMMALAEVEETPLGFVAADIPAMLSRQNISLIVDHVYDEQTVAELLDMNVAYAQGVVFAPPQAVQAETFDIPAPANAQNRPQPKPEPERRGLRDIARRTTA